MIKAREKLAQGAGVSRGRAGHEDQRQALLHPLQAPSRAVLVDKGRARVQLGRAHTRLHSTLRHFASATNECQFLIIFLK